MPTRAAAASAGFGVSLLIVARLFGLLEFHVAGSSLLIAPAVAFVMVRHRTNVPDVVRTANPAHPTAGDTITFDAEFRATGHTPTFEVCESYGDGMRANIHLAPLSNGEVRRLHLEVPTERRGIMNLGPTTFTIQDPLGLARHVKSVVPSSIIIVHPRRTPTTSPHLDDSSGLLIDALRAAVVNTPSDREFRGIREYARGDDVRMMNWKASARRDELLVNEFDPDCSIVLQIILDTDTSRHDDRSFDVAVSIAASLWESRGTTISRATLCVDRVTVDETRRVAGLDLLALAQPKNFDGRSSITLVDSPDPTTVLARIVVTGRGDRSLMEILSGFPTTGCAGVVIGSPMNEHPTPPGWMNLACADLFEFERDWPRFVRPAGMIGS